MIKLEHTEVMGWEHVIRGMRNPMNSWEMSDSGWFHGWADDEKILSFENSQHAYLLGPSDHELMMKLSKGGPVHAKYRRMITVYVDITAPLYWWKEFDTYKVGTVANSTSTMHKIHAKEFAIDDFSWDHMCDSSEAMLRQVIDLLNKNRLAYLEDNDKWYWWQMIQLLPSSYNQKRTIMMNYEVLTGIYPMRKDHKLDEWHEFCDWIEGLPYSEIMIGDRHEW